MKFLIYNIMSIRNTNRIIDNNLEFKRELDLRVQNATRRMRAKKNNSFSNALQQTSVCSKCKRKMKKDIADMQIKNKDKIIGWHGNCPICVACILGNKRSDLKNKIKRTSYSGKAKIDFDKFIKKYRK